MKPRYEIHSIGMPGIVEPVEKSQAEQRDRAARALFSATEIVNTNRFEKELGRTASMTKYGEYAGRYQTRFLAQLRSLSAGDLTKSEGPKLRDAWGANLRIERVPWAPSKKYYLMRSAGPDKRFNTPDDLAAYVGRPWSDTFDVNIEHDCGPFNGLAEIVGSVKDQSGAEVPQVQGNGQAWSRFR